ncbi:N-alpha-acetyltransferase 20 [Lucilia cuprina]|nr:N-alpha-acetyltransferase 20 [Lucilia cuprina]
MASLTPLEATDLLEFNAINLDVLTENYDLEYYLLYFCKWPSLNFKVEDTNKHPIGYMLGKSEGLGFDWHSHISAVTVEKDYRRLGLGNTLVDQLRLNSDASDQNWLLLWIC